MPESAPDGNRLFVVVIIAGHTYDVGCWPVASIIVAQRFGRFRGRSGHRPNIAKRSLETLSDISPPSIAALQKVYSTTSSDGEQADQEAFLNAWLTLRAIGSALSAAVFCPSAVSSLVCSSSVGRTLMLIAFAVLPHHRF